MSKPKLYLETTIPSYLTARPSRDVVATARQQLTREWWERERHNYRIFVSEVVISEAEEGDPEAARSRIGLIRSFPSLDVDEFIKERAAILMDEIPLPLKAATDALHLAIAITHEIEYLLTWNCRHLAQAQVRRRVEEICKMRGWPAPTICTPEELSDEDRTVERPGR